MDTKKCSACGLELPLSEYNKNKNSKDGLQDKCRKCFSAYNKKRYESNREKFKADVRKYREDHLDSVFDTRMRMCERNPNHKNANEAVSLAVQLGLLEKPDVCYGCGCTNREHRIEAHHHDYSKPLEVIWLCTPCHRRMDANRRVREGLKPYGQSKEQ